MFLHVTCSEGSVFPSRSALMFYLERNLSLFCHIRSSMVSKGIITAHQEETGVSQTCPVAQMCGSTHCYNSVSLISWLSTSSLNAAYIAYVCLTAQTQLYKSPLT